MIWMDVDAALSKVPVNAVPLINDTDFKSLETAVAYNAAGMALYWHFVTTAGVETTTQVTPTTSGAYDWAHAGQAIYTIEIPASGGASINNDTEGFGYFTGYATGVLPWRGPTIGFRAAGLNNLLIDDAHSATRGLSGTALPAAAADAAGGLIISDAGGLDADAQRSDVAAILVDTGTTLQGELDGIQSDTEDIQSRLPAALVGGRIDATVDDTGMEAGAVTAIQSGLATAAELAKVPKSDSTVSWNATAAAQIQSEAADALTAYAPPTYTQLLNFIRVLCRKDAAIATDLLSVISAINADLASGAGSFANTTDGLEAGRDNVGTAGAGLTDLGGMSTAMKAQVNAEVVDCLATDTYAEPSAVPAATSSIKDKINWMFSLLRNKRTQTATTETLRNDADAASIATSTKSDDGTTLTRGEWT